MPPKKRTVTLKAKALIADAVQLLNLAVLVVNSIEGELFALGTVKSRFIDIVLARVCKSYLS